MVNRMTGIYCIENQINGKKYVGQAINIEKRWKQHKQKLKNDSHYNEHLQRSWNYYGESAFSFYVLELCDEESLNDREIYYIKALNAFENGYNMTLGGEGTRGYLHTEEHKKYMHNMFVGKVFSESTRLKMSLAKKGIPQPETEARKKGRKIVSKKLKGIKQTEEHRKKNSESHKGKPAWNKGMKMTNDYIHPMQGKHHSEETKSKISRANSGKKRSKEQRDKISKPIICIETGEIFASITEAADKHDVTIGAISRVLRGKSKTCCGLHWSYYER